MLVLAALTGCAGEPAEPLPAAEPARPQRAQLGWREVYGESSERLVFTVDSLAVLENGWQASVAVENATQSRFAVASGAGALAQAFGLMLFPNGDLEELERLNRAGELPAIRGARTFTPPLPRSLGPGERWQGTIAARGSLPAGAFVRVVFGAFVADGDPPEGLEEQVVWITDHAHRLQPAAGHATSVAKAGSLASAARSGSPAAISR